jgi:hypothetical protein
MRRIAAGHRKRFNLKSGRRDHWFLNAARNALENIIKSNMS